MTLIEENGLSNAFHQVRFQVTLRPPKNREIPYSDYQVLNCNYFHYKRFNMFRFFFFFRSWNRQV